MHTDYTNDCPEAVCPACGECNAPIGYLGRHAVYSCRGCGMEYQRPVPSYAKPAPQVPAYRPRMIQAVLPGVTLAESAHDWANRQMAEHGHGGL